MKAKTILRASALTVISFLFVNVWHQSNEDRFPEEERGYIVQNNWEPEKPPQAELPWQYQLFPWPPDSFRYAENRAFEDRPDDFPGKQIHAMFVLPSNVEDNEMDTSGLIAVSMESIQLWLENETGGRRLRLDTYQGMLDVTFLRIPHESTEENESMSDPGQEISNLVKAAGFNDPNKLYAIHYLGWGGSCGLGGPALGAIAYLRCMYDPDLNYIPGKTMVHELIHAMGTVYACAPNADGAGHVSDSSSDIMYQGNEILPPYLVLDYGRDDYYGHGRDDCTDIAKSPFLHPAPGNQTT